MLMSQFLKSRKTVRDYKKKALLPAAQESIRALLDEKNERLKPYHAKLVFFHDGGDIKRVLEDKGGYAGVMIEAPAYIGMIILEESEEAYVRGAYEMEDVTTKLYDLNLGSCWVSLDGVEDEILEGLAAGEGKTVYLLAVGYPIQQLGIGEIPFSSRLGVLDLVNGPDGKKLTMEELENLGLDDLFYYVRYAPSAYNHQPWRFTIEDGKVTMRIENYKEKVTLVDAGIMMYYFEAMLRSLMINEKFTLDIHDEGADKVIGSVRI